MKCEKCGKAPWDGITLLRQNPKGEIGIWRCEACNKKPVPDDTAQIIADIQDAMKRVNQELFARKMKINSEG